MTEIRESKTFNKCFLGELEIGWVKKSNGYQVAKRLFDIIFSWSGLILILPLLVIIAVAIKVTSPGPIINKYKRIGRYGKLITVYKFRTTYLNRNEGDKPKFTTVGSYLWKTDLQELPLYINVIMGDMSFVGPRPMLPSELDWLDENKIIRLSVKPGITGLRSVIYDYDASMLADIDYVKRASFLLDMKIILLTMGRVLKGD